jgi:hypothetical protein
MLWSLAVARLLIVITPADNYHSYNSHGTADESGLVELQFQKDKNLAMTEK